jgi:undecaprenyl diphosphate synthase
MQACDQSQACISIIDKRGIFMDLEQQVLAGDMPQHIAVIMDGNRRWAKKRLLPSKIGHREGSLRVIDLVKNCSDLGVKYVSVYAFSTENWKRDKKEVDYLMNLLVEFVNKELDYLNRENVKVKLMGNIEDLPEKTKQEVTRCVEATKNNSGLVLTIALSYGSRDEIISAVKKIYRDLENNKIKIDQIDEESFSDYLYTKDIPDPDLLIRTSGEERVSNFLLYQIAYTEFYFTEVMWPDFNKEELMKAIYNFQLRKRRYGN